MPGIRPGNERKRKNMFELRAKVSSALVSDEQLNKVEASICDDIRIYDENDKVGHFIDNRASIILLLDMDC